jgi:hypothetical protein
MVTFTSLDKHASCGGMKTRQPTTCRLTFRRQTTRRQTTDRQARRQFIDHLASSARAPLA